MSEFVVSGEELDQLQEDASVSKAIKELASILTGRADDVPHRFRAPGKFCDYFGDWNGSNTSMFHQLPLTYNNSMPLMLLVTTRPAQKILELVFQDANGSRLFTLEIEYGE
jgi:hypothetical protein